MLCHYRFYFGGGGGGLLLFKTLPGFPLRTARSTPVTLVKVSISSGRPGWLFRQEPSTLHCLSSQPVSSLLTKTLRHCHKKKKKMGFQNRAAVVPTDRGENLAGPSAQAEVA